MLVRRLRPAPHLTTLRPCPPLPVVISWRKQADARLVQWSEQVEGTPLEAVDLADSALSFMRELRNELRRAEVFPPTMMELSRRRQDAQAWGEEVREAASSAVEPVTAVRRLLRLWIGTAQQAAICGGAAAFAA